MASVGYKVRVWEAQLQVSELQIWTLVSEPIYHSISMTSTASECGQEVCKTVRVAYLGEMATLLSLAKSAREWPDSRWVHLPELFQQQCEACKLVLPQSVITSTTKTTSSLTLASTL